jgi:hypothetical protein
MEIQLILSVFMSVRAFIRIADRFCFGLPITALGFEWLFPDPIASLAFNPIRLPPLARIFGLLTTWLALSALVGFLIIFSVQPACIWIQPILFPNLPHKDLVLIGLALSTVFGLATALVISLRLTKGIGIEFNGSGTIFRSGQRAVLVPWTAWRQTGEASRKSWASSLVIVPCLAHAEVILEGTNVSGTAIQGSPVSVDMIDGMVFLVIRDDLQVPALELAKACQAISWLGKKTNQVFSGPRHPVRPEAP